MLNLQFENDDEDWIKNYFLELGEREIEIRPIP